MNQRGNKQSLSQRANAGRMAQRREAERLRAAEAQQRAILQPGVAAAVEACRAHHVTELRALEAAAVQAAAAEDHANQCEASASVCNSESQARAQRAHARLAELQAANRLAEERCAAAAAEADASAAAARDSLQREREAAARLVASERAANEARRLAAVSDTESTAAEESEKLAQADFQAATADLEAKEAEQCLADADVAAARSSLTEAETGYAEAAAACAARQELAASERATLARMCTAEQMTGEQYAAALRAGEAEARAALEQERRQSADERQALLRQLQSAEKRAEEAGAGKASAEAALQQKSQELLLLAEQQADKDNEMATRLDALAHSERVLGERLATSERTVLSLEAELAAARAEHAVALREAESGAADLRLALERAVAQLREREEAAAARDAERDDDRARIRALEARVAELVRAEGAQAGGEHALAAELERERAEAENHREAGASLDTPRSCSPSPAAQRPAVPAASPKVQVAARAADHVAESRSSDLAEPPLYGPSAAEDEEAAAEAAHSDAAAADHQSPRSARVCDERRGQGVDDRARELTEQCADHTDRLDEFALDNDIVDCDVLSLVTALAQRWVDTPQRRHALIQLAAKCDVHHFEHQQHRTRMLCVLNLLLTALRQNRPLPQENAFVLLAAVVALGLEEINIVDSRAATAGAWMRAQPILQEILPGERYVLQKVHDALHPDLPTLAHITAFKRIVETKGKTKKKWTKDAVCFQVLSWHLVKLCLWHGFLSGKEQHLYYMKADELSGYRKQAMYEATERGTQPQWSIDGFTTRGKGKRFAIKKFHTHLLAPLLVGLKRICPAMGREWSVRGNLLEECYTGKKD